ncbi:MAG: C4-dicarboxylate ABC transporter, partial [Rhodospirillales bacterium]|nr:C4-dicarboxylate ABC transporter [Rhodospirillales bacterium]
MKITKLKRSMFHRRLFMAAAFSILMAPLGMSSSEAAEAKALRISTPGVPAETQSKSLIVFKTALEQLLPGQFDTQIHLNGTLFAQGTEIPAMQRGNLEMALISAQDI